MAEAEHSKRKPHTRYNLQNLTGQPGKLLSDGEMSRTHRVRAAPEVHDWFSNLTAEERGEKLSKLMDSE
jgi:hypothetical protein